MTGKDVRELLQRLNALADPPGSRWSQKLLFLLVPEVFLTEGAPVSVKELTDRPELSHFLCQLLRDDITVWFETIASLW